VNNEKEQTYGGAQQWFSRKYLRNSGCGYIACTNIIVHKNKSLGQEGQLPKEEYMAIAKSLRRYMLVLPKFGMSGPIMAVGMNLFFLTKRLPYWCFWGISGKRRDGRIEKMLEDNTPVVMCIGQNFPNVWGKRKLRLYEDNGSVYTSNSDVHMHFVSVTGMDDEWYRISSWGKMYYINKKEFNEYVKKHSLSFFSNVLVVKHINRRNK